MKMHKYPLLSLLLALVLSLALSACAPVAPAPTPGPTALPVVPTVPVIVNVQVERQADGSSLVSDLGNTYAFTLAQEWTAIPVTQERVTELAQDQPAPDAEFLGLARKMLEQRSDAFRLVGVSTDSRLAQAASPALVLVTAIPDGIAAALPTPELARMIQDTVFTGMQGVKGRTVTNANGLNLAVVEGPYEYLTSTGETLPARSRVVGFAANARVILIQFIASQESADDVLPGTDPVIDSILRLKP